MTAKRFHLGDIMTVAFDKFVTVNGLPGVAALLGFMTGESVATHQISRAIDECAPELLRQHPQLATVEIPERFDLEATEHHVRWWLQQQVDRYGEHLDVTPLAEVDHTHIDPVTELAMKAPHLGIIAVEGS